MGRPTRQRESHRIQHFSFLFFVPVILPASDRRIRGVGNDRGDSRGDLFPFFFEPTAIGIGKTAHDESDCIREAPQCVWTL
jgi:hypothetical protein